MDVTALGMIETVGLVSSIEAADAGLKAADVRLLGTDYVRGGLVMVRFEGEVAAVQAAVDAGAAAARRVGTVLSAHVIPRAMPEVFCMLASDVSVGPGKLFSGGCAQCGGCEGGRREAEAIERAKAEHEGRAERSTERALERSTESTAHWSTEHEPKQSTEPINRWSTEHGSAKSTTKASGRSTQPKHTTSDAGPERTALGSAPASSATAAPYQLDDLVTLAMDESRLSGMKVLALRQLVRRLPRFPMTANEIRYSSKQQLLQALAEWRASRR